MNLDTIRVLAEKNLSGRRPNQNRETGYIYHHCLRVANIAGELAVRTGAPRDEFDPVLYIGALFHDVGKGLARHNEIGAVMAADILSDQLTAEDLQGVCEIVRFHCVRKHEIDLPARVLLVQDADIIDHYGTQEVWLQFQYAANRNTPQPEVSRHWTTSSYRKRLDRVRELLNYDVSIEIFDERVAFQQRFFERFEAEATGSVHDPPAAERPHRREPEGGSAAGGAS